MYRIIDAEPENSIYTYSAQKDLQAQGLVTGNASTLVDCMYRCGTGIRIKEMAL